MLLTRNILFNSLNAHNSLILSKDTYIYYEIVHKSKSEKRNEIAVNIAVKNINRLIILLISIVYLMLYLVPNFFFGTLKDFLLFCRSAAWDLHCTTVFSLHLLPVTQGIQPKLLQYYFMCGYV